MGMPNGYVPCQLCARLQHVFWRLWDDVPTWSWKHSGMEREALLTLGLERLSKLEASFLLFMLC